MDSSVRHVEYTYEEHGGEAARVAPVEIITCRRASVEKRRSVGGESFSPTPIVSYTLNLRFGPSSQLG